MVPPLSVGLLFFHELLTASCVNGPAFAGMFSLQLARMEGVDVVWMLLFLELIIFVSYLDKPLRHTISAGGSLCHETKKSEIVN